MQPGAVVLACVGGQEGIILIIQFVELYVGFTALGHFDNPLATPSLQFYNYFTSKSGNSGTQAPSCFSLRITNQHKGSLA